MTDDIRSARQVIASARSNINDVFMASGLDTSGENAQRFAMAAVAESNLAIATALTELVDELYEARVAREG
ncbi:hypothetical protein [Microbacterium sp. BH-3-3-3]|uniref:hypothetical protein n=1 Tax=Microbacterium sp. BH-3-3-3 TaxID=1906742 RepID=UPI00119D17EF|nr:hypothetical protein [Microbacterium sp. BH-3-3-3]